MAAQFNLTFLMLGSACFHKQAANPPAPTPAPTPQEIKRKQIVHERALSRGAGVPKPRHAPGADFPLIEDSPGQINPIAAGVRSLHTGAKPGLQQFQGNLGFLNPVMDMAWNMMIPPGNQIQGQNPYTQSPWLHNIPEVYRQGGQATEHALRTFRPYENGLSPELAPFLPLIQQYGPQLMAKMGSAPAPIGLMF